MRPAVTEFLIFVGDGGVDAVSQPKPRIDPATFLPLEQFGIQDAGIHHDTGGVGAAFPPVRVEGLPSAVTAVVRLAKGSEGDIASFRRGRRGTLLVFEGICTVWASSVLSYTMSGFIGTEIQGNDASDLMKA